MDIFRKKKVKKLLDELEDTNNMLIQERSKNKKLQESANNFERISTQVLEENQILIEWIRKILDTFGTMEVRSRMNVQIPIYKDVIRPIESSPFQPQIKERIEIPPITIMKMG